MLMKLLDGIETGNEPIESSLNFMSSQPKPVLHNKQTPHKIVKVTAPKGKKMMGIKVISTYGHVEIAGIAEIELFDMHGLKI